MPLARLLSRGLLLDLVTRAAGGDFGMAMELAYQYLARERVERTYAEAPPAGAGHADAAPGARARAVQRYKRRRPQA